ncbi:MAG: hypothetical protein U0236_22890 [Nitrospira sp.]
MMKHTAVPHDRLIDLEKTIVTLDHRVQMLQCNLQQARGHSLTERLWSLMGAKPKQALMSGVCNRRVRPNTKVVPYASPRA